ncbi:phosphatase PAP2 family protein [Notoacmeibacter sp. MSK16QG-6]|uniref:phosphatase PAP2 family protein n=1 Tax=Notoacmeibacter sp. MSK16QG-6 TaxID=2957982 RepID=UPI00209D10D6|nr:phosphatase PAP2 family protein [Notoacmeibacter sp. MSK16QG-6]MCP1198822.1 phosphatase PAP2 family protein [Notoacmeibacter sp. MSK16QG-6]
MSLLADSPKTIRHDSALRRSVLPPGEGLLFGIALATAAIGQAIGILSGRRTDMGVVTSVLGDLASLGVFVLAGASLALFIGAARRRSKTPARDILTALFGFLFDGARFLRFARTAAIFIFFAIGFGELKGLAAWGGFAWDESLMHLDRWLHFGRLPHEWLRVFYDWPLAVQIVNFVYNLWYFVMIGAFLAIGIGWGSQEDRFRFLLAFMTSWLVGGVLIASIFSSAGPCFYGRLDFGGEYSLLMARLGVVDLTHALYALSTQDMLWESYAEGSSASSISAFPSLHVATATLIALLGWRKGWLGRVAGTAFMAMILFGSVLLGWHYAVDGYAGIAIALGAWKFAGMLSGRLMAGKGYEPERADR